MRRYRPFRCWQRRWWRVYLNFQYLVSCGLETKHIKWVLTEQMEKRTSIGTSELSDLSTVLDELKSGNTTDGRAFRQSLVRWESRIKRRLAIHAQMCLLPKSSKVFYSKTYGKLININFQEESISVLLGELSEDWSNFLAGTAPFGKQGIK